MSDTSTNADLDSTPMDGFSTEEITIDPVDAVAACVPALERAVTAAAAADQSLPTPCAEYNLGELMDHTVMALKYLGRLSEGHVRVPEGASPAEAIMALTEQTLRGWRERGLNGEVGRAANVTMPAVDGVHVFFDEMVLHTWDFEQALGLTAALDEGVIAAMSARSRRLIDKYRAKGAYGPAQPAPATASAIDQLAAYSGRSVRTVG